MICALQDGLSFLTKGKNLRRAIGFKEGKDQFLKISQIQGFWWSSLGITPSSNQHRVIAVRVGG